MRGIFQHLGALPRGLRNLPNPVDRFLSQLCADRRQPARGKQTCTASALLSVVADAVASLTATRLVNFAIQRQGEQLADAEACDDQNGKRGGAQRVSRFDGMLAIDIRETLQHGFGRQAVATCLLARDGMTVEVLYALSLRGVV